MIVNDDSSILLIIMMKKVMIVLVALILLATVGVVFYLSQQQKAAVTSESTPAPQVNVPTEGLLFWKDPAGFKFSYNNLLKMNSHPEDQENYANLELTTADHPGKIIILVKDTKYKTAGEWLAGQKGVSAFDAELGGKPAKKALWTVPKKTAMVAIDGNAIVSLEVYPEDEWWQGEFDKVVSSFEFTPLASEQGSETAAPAAAESHSGVVEEEEVVE